MRLAHARTLLLCYAAPASRALSIAAPAAAFFAPARPRARQPARCDAGSSAEEFDVIVIGSGIGGLCAGVMASRFGLKTLVVEAHYEAGGAAHSFERTAAG